MLKPRVQELRIREALREPTLHLKQDLKRNDGLKMTETVGIRETFEACEALNPNPSL